MLKSFVVIITIIGTILLSIPIIIVNGFVIAQFWTWFIAHIFSIRLLSIPEAIGLSLITRYFTHQISMFNFMSELERLYREQVKSELKLKHVQTTGLQEYLLVCIGRPIVALTIGWFVHQFI